MKKVQTVVEVEGEGLVALLGEDVMVMCSSYFYTGKLTGVNDTCILIEDCSLVYETGPWSTAGFKDAQKMQRDVYIQVDHIEAFFAV